MEDTKKYPYLDNIDFPADLRKVAESDLRFVATDVREYLIDTISKIGGHFGAGLGTVELAVALHYVFQTPYDKIVWDVGHQAYPHKILTGRKEELKTIRQPNGISGFLRRVESEYDTFGAGHASTSISAALGIATARDFDKKDYKVVAVIGDGSMTGGMAYEAMNNCGLLRKDIIVILNDNKMSIAPNMWSVSNYFNELVTNTAVRKFKDNVWEITGKMDDFGDRIRSVAGKLVDGVKAVVTPGMLFEALGFKYFGPVNGHNVSQLVKMLRFARNEHGPILLHVMTQKGKGYKPAEDDVKQNLHAVTPFDKITGASIKSPTPQPVQPPSYTKVFGNAMVELCKANPKVIGVTAAMPDGTGLDILQDAMPERFFDVGIAEQHAVTFCAGMATEGYTPVAAIYSTFLQRAFDQIVHDVAIQKLNVIFALDRAGLVGADGPTHHGALDLAYLRCIQGMVVMAPKDESELRDMLYTATEYRKGPIALRYPRGNGTGVEMKKGFERIPIGKAEVLRTGKDVAILAIGSTVYPSLKAAEELSSIGIDAEVVNMRFVKPLDNFLLDELGEKFSLIVTVEDGVRMGGFGSAVAEHFGERAKRPRIVIHGLPDEFIEHGSPAGLAAAAKLDAKGIAEIVREAVSEDVSIRK